ncbi:MAG: hypothetical protein B7Z38_01880 [Rhodobacterales bacterium 12-64-8]|nr:MAG: hypothetical protein B7Z38_01880 [Rhodobacterales bacterium 12-64-8]OYX46353.1 MAG: hypothetical protein B7Y90_16095 [Alphaproteobacteria bacterium 32-64-14]
MATRRRLWRVACCAALSAAASAIASAQIPLTQVEGSRFECGGGNIAACVDGWEKRLIDAHPGEIRRTADGWLSVKLADGNWTEVGDECPTCHFAMDLLQDDRFLAIIAFGEENIYWQLLDRRTGRLTDLEGYPLFSPDGQKIAIGERDEMNANALDIYDLTDAGPVRVFRGILPTEDWAPQQLCWVSNTIVGYERAKTDAPYDKPGAPEALVFRDGKWSIQPGKAGCSLTS